MWILSRVGPRSAGSSGHRGILGQWSFSDGPCRRPFGVIEPEVLSLRSYFVHAQLTPTCAPAGVGLLSLLFFTIVSISIVFIIIVILISGAILIVCIIIVITSLST